MLVSVILPCIFLKMYDTDLLLSNHLFLVGILKIIPIVLLLQRVLR